MHVAPLDHGFGGSYAFPQLVEVRDLEPEQSAVPERHVMRRKRPVVIFDVDVVQLQDELAVADELLVLVATMRASAPRICA